MSPVDSWLFAEILAFLFACTRATGIIVAAPLSWATAPARVRVVLVLLLGLAGYSQRPAVDPGLARQSTLVPLVTELGIGLAMGFVVRLAIAAAEITGELMAPLMGIGAAQMFDPATHTPENVLAKILRNFAVLLALLVGVHRVLLEGLLASYRVLPIGSSLDPSRAFPSILALSNQALLVGARIALPLLAILFMTQVTLAFIARAAPAMQIFNVGFAVTLSVGGLVLVMIMPDVGHGLLADLSHVGIRIESVLLDLGALP
ncbi:MAG: flagellar biosynthetic protein FliR [Polyangiaceae bacterium]|nr:flagellar biosynthetic protein FliR [Polyangiaceae bacterium]